MSTALFTSAPSEFERAQLNFKKEKLEYKKRKLEAPMEPRSQYDIIKSIAMTNVASGGPNNEYLTFYAEHGAVVLVVQKAEIRLIYERVNTGGGNLAFPIQLTLKDNKVIYIGSLKYEKTSEVLNKIFTEFVKK